MRHDVLGSTDHAADDVSQAGIHYQVLQLALILDVAVFVLEHDAQFTREFEIFVKHVASLESS